MRREGPPSNLGAALRREADKQAWVNWLFSHVAPRYDLGNDLMSVGWHTRWKRRLVDLAEVRPGQRVLDLACGTGDVTWMVAARGAEVIGTDINPDMMAHAAHKRPPGLEASFVEADAVDLPFEAGAFDLVTCAYAGRGFPDWPAVLREVHRVLAPGGTFWNLDFARPPNRLWDHTYRGWMKVSGAVLGTVLHGDPRTYVYIPASMAAYPGQRWLRDRMTEAGFEATLHETVGCLMAFNGGVKRG